MRCVGRGDCGRPAARMELMLRWEPEDWLLKWTDGIARSMGEVIAEVMAGERIASFGRAGRGGDG